MSLNIHICADKNNAAILSTLLDDDNQLYILPDSMIDGVLKGDEGDKFDAVRNTYKSQLSDAIGTIFTEEKGNVATIMEVSALLTNVEDSKVVYWMGGNATDVIGYFFILHFLRSHYERIQVINIAGLPFLDDDMKLFFPNNIAELPPAQIIKALKLKRSITPSELEIDGEEWKSIRDANAAIRILDGNKKIKSAPVDHYDSILQTIHKPGSKFSRSIQIANSKNNLALSPEFIEFRLLILSQNKSTTEEPLSEN